MDADHEALHRRVPSLVQLCQRAAIAQVANADSICTLGDDLPYPLVKPILERCSIEQLTRLEQASPHLQKDTAEIWKDLCFRKYRMTAVERYSIDDDPQEPDSWRSRYFALEAAEAKRVDELGSRLRTQRMEADERKKEKEVKYTDRLPDPKRARTGSSWGSTPPKTLFQRTKSEASRYQRALNSRVLPPPPTSRNHRVLPQSAGAALPVASASSNRVTVNTVIHRRASTASSPTVSTPGAPSASSSGPSGKVPVPLPSYPVNPSRHPPARDTARTSPPTVAPRLEPSRATPKKDKLASLFVPKRPPPQGQARRPV